MQVITNTAGRYLRDQLRRACHISVLVNLGLSATFREDSQIRIWLGLVVQVHSQSTIVAAAYSRRDGAIKTEPADEIEMGTAVIFIRDRRWWHVDYPID